MPAIVRKIDGVYFQIPNRLSRTVDAILNTEPASVVADELAAVSGCEVVTVEDAVKILQNVFGTYGLVVTLSDGKETPSKILLTGTAENVSSHESAIRLKLTLLSKRSANILASKFAALFNKSSAIPILAICCAIFAYYALKFGSAVFGLAFIVATEQNLSAKDSVLLFV